MSHYVTLDNGTVWPINVGEIEWQLRYGAATKDDPHRLIAASVLNIYGRMIDQTITASEAELILHRARAAQREAASS